MGESFNQQIYGENLQLFSVHKISHWQTFRFCNHWATNNISITIYAGNLLEQQTLVKDLSRKVRRMMSVLSGRDGPICNV